MLNGNEIWTLSLLLGFLPLIPAYIKAESESKKLLESNKDHQPFVWGYTFSIGHYWSGALISISFILIYAFGGIPRHSKVEVFWIIIFSAISCVLGHHAAQRKRWALVLLTIFSWNILYFVVNYFYIKKRWNELDPFSRKLPRHDIDSIVLKIKSNTIMLIEKFKSGTLKEKYESLDFSQRMMIAMGILWVVVSFLYFVSFDKFDTDSEQMRAIYIMFIPPLIPLALRYIYLRERKRSKK